MKPTLTQTHTIAGKATIKGMRLLILSFFVLLSSGVFAGNSSGSSETSARKTLYREITRSISCPDFITENDVANDVKVLLSVDESGKIIIHEMNGANDATKKYVEQKLKQTQLDNPAQLDTFVITVKFRV